ncbi:MAG: O-sialoglycoprotein endopeptidase [Nitrososphaerota archaeon]
MALMLLGIESTAHTFGVSVVEAEGNEGRILSDVKEVYKAKPGSGIEPGEAAQHHAAVAPGLLARALRAAGTSVKDLAAVAYSAGPGLGPCLRVGATVARALGLYYRKPLVPVHHAIGHIELGCLLTGARNPIVLLVTGGHTAILLFSSGRWRIFGQTLDITVGKLFDQFGREVGLSRPELAGFGGPSIEAQAGRSSAYHELPYSVKGNDVSFSGLLTEALRLWRGGVPLEEVCFSLQETAFAMLAEVVERALAFTGLRELLLVGGVAANERLRAMMQGVARRYSASCYAIPAQYAGDCGAQIAWAGALALASGMKVKPEEAFVRQAWRIDRVAVPWRG